MPFYPGWVELVLAIGIGSLTVASPASASLVFVTVLALPVLAANFVVGVVFLIMSLLATQYLSAERAGGFILVAIGIALVPVHAEWAMAVLAGYLLGRGRGSLVAVCIPLTVIGAGIALGVPAIGTIISGGTAPGLVAFSGAPADALVFGWLMPAVRAADPSAALEALVGVHQPLLVGSQLLVWAAGAFVGSAFRGARSAVLSLAGSAAGVATLAAGSLALNSLIPGPVDAGTVLAAAALSLPLALLGVSIALWVFPFTKPASVAAGAAPRDVDDLLRTIASAEDELASRHTAEAVVLITDMKSFSAMTEEIGSVASAKIVQRHRDLLLPMIEQHGGHGTPTGGDGLVAAFSTPAAALEAAVAMQQALQGYTGSDRSPHELAVRIGIASGEVVLDASGSPFLGGALNLAARVMDLADGGRIMTTGPVASAFGAGAKELHLHGEFKLKNIAEAVSVVEVLWRDGLSAQEIRVS